ncbi:chorismate mutase [Sphingomonas sp. PB2P12]|uniref:chorismate mutase n=1 Tax=Sphingomonas sandaracina TaxID=3096157 RepID=UPI002FC6EF2B
MAANCQKGVRVATDLLNTYRKTIDNIDAAVIFMLAERFKVTQAVGSLKAAHGHPAADPEREKRQIARLRQLADEAQLDPDFSEKFLRFIITEVIRHHEGFANAQACDGARVKNLHGAHCHQAL